MNFADPRAMELFGHYPEQLLADFKRYHRENPHIYVQFRKLAKKMREKRPYYSSKMIINALRWEYDLRGGDEFKINDKYQSLYGRLLVWQDPSFDGFFRFRYRGDDAALAHGSDLTA